MTSATKNGSQTKRGRPATGTAQKRVFRCHDADYKLIQHAAEADGVTVSKFIRDAALAAVREREPLRQFRCGDEDYNVIRQAAARRGLSVSDFVHDTALEVSRWISPDAETD